MWQRFTERTRRIILLAQDEAIKMNFAHVGTEHLLLGLMRDPECVAAQVLEQMGVSLEAVRQHATAEAQSAQSRSESLGTEPQLTPKSKRVLELAADEARRMKHNYIGTEHLLLALLREKDGLAAIVLGKLGLHLQEARAQVMGYLGPQSPAEVDDLTEAESDQLFEQSLSELVPQVPREVKPSDAENSQLPHPAVRELATIDLYERLLTEKDARIADLQAEVEALRALLQELARGREAGDDPETEPGTPAS